MTMKLSARNCSKDVSGGGSVVTASSITMEAVDELGLREGDSDVIVAKD